MKVRALGAGPAIAALEAMNQKLMMTGDPQLPEPDPDPDYPFPGPGPDEPEPNEDVPEPGTPAWQF